VRLGGAYVTATCGRDKDCAARVSSLTNEEPLVVVEAGVDIVREVLGKDCGDSRDSVIREGEPPLRRGRHWGVYEGVFGAKDRDIGHDQGIGRPRGLEVFTTRRGDKDVVRVDGDIFMKRGEEKSVEDFLGDVRRSRRHRQ
jgi:hypothetical protein